MDIALPTMKCYSAAGVPMHIALRPPAQHGATLWYVHPECKAATLAMVCWSIDGTTYTGQSSENVAQQLEWKAAA